MMSMAFAFGIPSTVSMGVAFGPTLVLLFAAVTALGFATSGRGLRKIATRHAGVPTARPGSTVRPAHAV